ncbi:helix-turn-helix transcriptional regulator [Kitasatospora sp. NPDC085879]|uniref:helix-turn-helix domain-containing protein n=1 Tax=Kitasatospora sp. NPDC085879 TaxID=3154769 RepID=UPI000BB13200|nr:helix-turn-helix transcriptional regulator [Streptomyces sp. TLI_235]PBC75809.1 tetratricopeptide repeat protein [Streptomyces sp. TLI_235]
MADTTTPADPDTAGTVGRRVHRLRVERGLTQRQLAEPAYTAAYISILESDRVRPSEAALRHVAERLGVTFEELATGRPPHIATGLRAELVDAQRLLALGEGEEAAAAYRRLLAGAERHGLDAERAAALLGLGQCALYAGDLAAARGHFEAAEPLLADAPPLQRARAVRGRAVAHLLAGELRYSCYLLESAIDELNSAGLQDPDALVLLYTASVAPYLDMGAHARAAQAAEIALGLAPQVTDPAVVAGMHRTVARTLLAEGRTAEADASLARAAALYEQLQIRPELAHCHWMRGYVHAQDGALDAAARELTTARDMLAAGRAELYTAQVEVELADVLRRLGRREEAGQLLLLLLDRLQPGRGPVHRAAAHRLLGLLAEDGEDTAAAEEHYGRALALLEPTGAAGDLADLCRLLGDLQRRLGRTEAALDTYRLGLGHAAAPGTTTLGPAPTPPPLTTP